MLNPCHRAHIFVVLKGSDDGYQIENTCSAGVLDNADWPSAIGGTSGVSGTCSTGFTGPTTRDCNLNGTWSAVTTPCTRAPHLSHYEVVQTDTWYRQCVRRKNGKQRAVAANQLAGERIGRVCGRVGRQPDALLQRCGCL